MITRFIPTVRGEMLFSVTAVGDHRTYTTKINVTGTTWSTTYFQTYSYEEGEATKTTTSTSTNSLTSQQTLSSFFTTTQSTISFVSTELSHTFGHYVYSTQTKTTDEENTQSWTTDETILTAEGTRAAITSAEGVKTVQSSSTTAVGNCYDTELICQSNEYLLVMDGTIPASGWSGNPMATEGMAVATSQTTLAADVKSSSVFVYGTAEQESIGGQNKTYSILCDTGGGYSSFDSFNFSVFPPTKEGPFGEYSTKEEEYFGEQYNILAFNHYGNTKLATLWFYEGKSFVSVTPGGQSFRQIAPGWSAAMSTKITVPTPAEFEGTGNTTYINTEQLLGLTPPVSFDLVRWLYVVSGVKIAKPIGVIYDGKSGAMFTADAEIPSSSASGHYALVGRTPETWGNGLSAFNEHDRFLFQHNYLYNLFTLFTTSNETWSLSGNSFTWTTTTATEAGYTTETTSSAKLGVSGQLRTRVVATKTVLGGSPEKSATFYQAVPRGVYFNQNGETVSTTGGAESWEYPETRETYVLRPCAYIEADGAQTLTVSRNPLLMEGEFNQSNLENNEPMDEDFAY